MYFRENPPVGLVEAEGQGGGDRTLQRNLPRVEARWVQLASSRGAHRRPSYGRHPPLNDGIRMHRRMGDLFPKLTNRSSGCDVAYKAVTRTPRIPPYRRRNGIGAYVTPPTFPSNVWFVRISKNSESLVESRWGISALSAGILGGREFHPALRIKRIITVANNRGGSRVPPPRSLGRRCRNSRASRFARRK